MRTFGMSDARAPAFALATKEASDAQRYVLEDDDKSLWAEPYESLRTEVGLLCDAFVQGTLEESYISANLEEYTWSGLGSLQQTSWNRYKDDIVAHARTAYVLLEIFSADRPAGMSHRAALQVVAEALTNRSNVKVAFLESGRNHIPYAALSLEESKDTQYVILGPGIAKPWGRKKCPSLKALPQILLQFTERMMHVDLSHETSWANTEVRKRLRKLQLMERDWEKRQQDEWMMREFEELERYKREGKL